MAPSTAQRKAVKEADLADYADRWMDDEIKEAAENPPDEPPFPILMVIAALMKDLLDGSDVTGIGIVITTFFSIILGGAIFVWIFLKSSVADRRVMQGVWKRYVAVFIMELIPLLKILPATLFLVLGIHFRRKRLVRDILQHVSRNRRKRG